MVSEFCARQQAVRSARAHVGDRRELPRQRLASPRDGRLGPRLPAQRLLARGRALRDRRHAAVGDTDVSHPALREPDVERAEQRRDVLVEAFGDLIAAELLFRSRQRHADQLDELAGLQRGLAVVEVEVLELQVAVRATLAQHHLGAERDQRGHGIADRRAVRDIAADRAGIPDLHRAEAADQLAEIGPARSESVHRVGVGDRRADLEMGVRHLEPRQLLDLADVNQRVEIAVLLGHPQAHVGAAGEQSGARKLLAQRRQVLDPARREVAPGAVRERQPLAAPKRLEVRDRLGLARAEVVALAQLVHAARGIDDRPVPGAAAEVAGKHVEDALPARRAVFMIEREQGHHEAGRAEAALRAVTLDHGLLHGVQGAVGPAQVLDRDQLLAVELRHEQDAGVDRAIADAIALELAQHHGTGAAIALGAAFLGAAAALHLAQPVQHGEVRIEPAQLARLMAEKEADSLGHQLPRYVV